MNELEGLLMWPSSCRWLLLLLLLVVLLFCCCCFCARVWSVCCSDLFGCNRVAGAAVVCVDAGGGGGGDEDV